MEGLEQRRLLAAAPAIALDNPLASLAEDADTSARIEVASITITDEDGGTNELGLAGDDAALFEIDADVLYLKAGTALDFETNPQLDVTVTVTDPDGNDEAPLTIDITDVNEAPTVALTDTVTSLAEDADTTTRVAVATITVDDDALGTNVLGLAGDDADLFEIDGGVLYLKAGTTLDFETQPQLDVTVTVTDEALGTDPADEAPLTIDITDVNEAPSLALADVVASLPEDTVTASPVPVATVVVTDDALGTNTLTLSGADADLFEIQGGVLYLKAGTTLDYETHPVLQVTVTLDDEALGGTAEGSENVEIQVTDANELPAVVLRNTYLALSENLNTATRVRVADIVVLDDAEGTHELSLSGADSNLFEILGNSLYLKAGTTLDYESQPLLSVMVAVDDPAVGATPDSLANLAIRVIDVNEAPAVTLIDTVETLRDDTDTTQRIAVATIVVADDALGTNTLSLSGADAGLFEIDGDVLYLKAGAELDAAAQALLAVTVNVNDPAVGVTPDSAVTLEIDVTATPVAEAGGPYTIAEGDDLVLAGVGPEGATFRWDIDGDGDFDEEITGAAPTVPWSVLDTLGLDGPTTRTVTLEATVDGEVFLATTTLEVTNAAPTFTFDESTLWRHAGATIDLQGSVADASSADALTVTIDWGDTASAVLTGQASFDIAHTYTADGEYTITVTATDGDGGTTVVTRQVIVGAVSLDGGLLDIVGTENADTVALGVDGDNLTLTASFLAAPAAIPLADVTAIHVTLLGENDLLTTDTAIAAPMLVDGGSGDDDLQSGSGNDVILGGDGDDYLYGDWGNDTLDGGAGFDRLYGQMGDDVLRGGADRDVISGQGGHDLVDGQDGDDLLYGNGGHDRILGGAGNDRLYGYDGHDILLGGTGNDRIYGATGRDVIIAGQGADYVMGHAEEDLIVGGTTAYDADQDALAALLAEWVSGSVFADRVAKIGQGFGAGDAYKLAANDTVLADGDADTLAGNGAADWYFADSADNVVTGGGDLRTDL